MWSFPLLFWRCIKQYWRNAQPRANRFPLGRSLLLFLPKTTVQSGWQMRYCSRSYASASLLPVILSGGIFPPGPQLIPSIDQHSAEYSRGTLCGYTEFSLSVHPSLLQYFLLWMLDACSEFQPDFSTHRALQPLPGFPLSVFGNPPKVRGGNPGDIHFSPIFQVSSLSDIECLENYCCVYCL